MACFFAYILHTSSVSVLLFYFKQEVKKHLGLQFSDMAAKGPFTFVAPGKDTDKALMVLARYFVKFGPANRENISELYRGLYKKLKRKVVDELVKTCCRSRPIH